MSQIVRRAFAIVEYLVAVILVWGFGFASLSAHRVGGDGIATGIAGAFAPTCILIGLGVAYAATALWRGTPRWGILHLKMIAGAAALLVGTPMFLIVAA
jgi:hypothetical protein